MSGKYQGRSVQQMLPEKLERNLAKMQDAFFAILLQVLHLLFDLLYYLAEKASSAGRTLSRLASSLTQEGRSMQKPDFVRVQRDLGALEKRPEHLAVVLAEQDEVSWSDMARLVSWAMAGGVGCISLYDGEGRLKAGQGRLLEALKREAFEELAQTEVVWKGHRTQEEGSEDESVRHRSNGGNGTSNGTSSSSSCSSKVEVCLLSEEDGKPDIVRAARSLARRVRQADLSASAVDETAVSSGLSACRGLPDPDLLLLFGPAHSGGGGYPPWQLRLTELHRLPSLAELEYADFLGVLRSFSRCETRFGK